MIDFKIKGLKVHKASYVWPLLALAFVNLAISYAIADTVSDEVNTHVLQAQILLQQQEYKKAASEYRQAAELSRNIDVAKKATRVAFSYGFNEDAIRSAQRWLQLDENSDEALLYVAQLQLRLGAIKASRRAFNSLLKRGEQAPDERLISLIPLLLQEDAKDADKLMRQLARPYKRSAAAQYATGIISLQAGDARKAMECASRALKLKPDWLKAQLLKARAMLLAGDQEDAIDYMSRIVGDSPNPDPEARMELAIMLISEGRDDDALSQVNQILLEQSGRTDALRLMAIINFRLDNLDAAWADFQDVLSSGHFTMDALYYLGQISDRRAEHEQAVRLYSKVVRGRNVVSSQKRVSAILAQQGKSEEALKHLRQFGAYNPNYAIDMVEAEAQVLILLERFPEALRVYERVIEYRPDSEIAVLGKAELLLRMGRLDDAINEYRQSVKRWPDSAVSLNALGYTLADRTEKYAEAEKLIKKALKRDPESAAIIDSYGWVLYRLGKNKRALKELQRAYAKLKNPEVAYHIVEVLRKLEQQEEALKVLKEAQLLNPNSKLLKEVRKSMLSEDR